MENNQALARRRRDIARGGRTERSLGDHSAPLHHGDLRRWRRVLVRMEREAARCRLGDVEMLLGAARLAIEDVMGPSTPSRA